MKKMLRRCVQKLVYAWFAVSLCLAGSVTGIGESWWPVVIILANLALSGAVASRIPLSSKDERA